MRLNLSKLNLGWEPLAGDHHSYTDESPRAGSVVSACETNTTEDYESLTQEGDSVQVTLHVVPKTRSCEYRQSIIVNQLALHL